MARRPHLFPPARSRGCSPHRVEGGACGIGIMCAMDHCHHTSSAPFPRGRGQSHNNRAFFMATTLFALEGIAFCTSSLCHHSRGVVSLTQQEGCSNGAPRRVPPPPAQRDVWWPGVVCVWGVACSRPLLCPLGASPHTQHSTRRPHIILLHSGVLRPSSEE